MISPTFIPLNIFLLLKTAAKVIAQDGSTIIFIVSHISFIESIISSSPTVKIPEALSFIIGNVRVPICALKPSQIVFVN